MFVFQHFSHLPWPPGLGAWYWFFSSCAYMWFSHMRKYDALCASGSFLRYVAACFVITCSMTMASSIMFEHLLRFSSGYNRPLSNIFGHLIWCHILCVFDLIYFSIILFQFISKHATLTSKPSNYNSSVTWYA